MPNKTAQGNVVASERQKLFKDILKKKTKYEPTRKRNLGKQKYKNNILFQRETSLYYKILFEDERKKQSALRDISYKQETSST